MTDDVPVQGLSTSEASSRLSSQGPNSVPTAPAHSVRSLLGKLMGPVPWMLEAAAVLELVVGKITEAAIVLALLVFNAVLSAVQEGRAADALTLLQQRLSSRCRVLRDGGWQRIDAVGLVGGDVVHIRLGEIVPADLATSSTAPASGHHPLRGRVHCQRRIETSTLRH